MLENRIARLAGNAIARHSMIKEGDRILVAFSGGKDSFTLLNMLQRFQRRAPVRFDLLPGIIDSGFGTNYKRAEEYLKKSGMNYIMKKSRIASVIKKEMQNSAPGKKCFLCARLRRGVLYRMAIENKCTKIALGHNADDAIETLLLNMFYVSKMQPMLPIFKSEDGRNTVIRPLIDVPEHMTKEYAEEKGYNPITEKCPLKKKDSKRRMIKGMLAKLSRENRQFHSSCTSALAGLFKQ